MSELMIFTAKKTAATNPLEHYQQSSASTFTLDVAQAHQARVKHYALIDGRISVLSVTLYVAMNLPTQTIMRARQAAVKAALLWHKQQSAHAKTPDQRYVLSLDIQEDEQGAAGQVSESSDADSVHLLHHFGARYFIEELVIDSESDFPLLQVFGQQDWQAVLTHLPSPADIWQFLLYHERALRASILGEGSDFLDETQLLTAFLYRPERFVQALEIDEALVACGIADAPNRALQHLQQQLDTQATQDTLQQAATLWGDICKQHTEPMIDDDADETSLAQAQLGQQVLFDESLFSRHELVRTLYKHAEQIPELQQKGYVIHQHSYTRLGRHYMLIFYGQTANARHSRQAIVPNMAKIAEDVAARLPLDALSQVVVLGVEFISEGEDTFIDMDVWVQPVAALSQNERRMAQKIKRLHAQVQQQNAQAAQASENRELPNVRLHYSVPPRS
ncbi:hypothetical protein [Psychrobacter aestuarii]|uniref:Uncharacterized protein n=1 Tax=Psychrobacter aestuarii TaxID=556327 RepID=A0ABP3FA43_9GAMM|nr:hypothetical protein [Psychrobacter aestuarii]